jgi:HD-GYP domain-containing protein (c-di-GMP phosphodiesterase class II)
LTNSRSYDPTPLITRDSTDGARILAHLPGIVDRGSCRSCSDELVEVRREPYVVVFATSSAYRSGAVERHLGAQDVPRDMARLIVVGELGLEELAEAKRAGLSSLLSAAATDAELLVATDRAFELLELQRRSASHGERLSRFEYELDELIDIARALTRERDIAKLLDLILEKARFVTGADAGSIYVIENGEPPEADQPPPQTLHFKQTQNESIPFDMHEFQMPVSRSSMAGWVVLERQSIRIADVYQLPPDSPFGFDRSFDARTGYRGKSMLCAPLVGGRGDVIGVLQLINKKRRRDQKLLTAADVERFVVPFDDRSEQLLVTLSAQAGIALENAMLIEEIRELFEGFVRASVDAIEARDPTTSGHSRRVAELTLRLAEAVDRTEVGPYRSVRFGAEDLRELQYASLLHDFGKIGVREPVLVKAKKLYPFELETIRLRIELGLRDLEVQRYARHLEIIRRGGTEGEFSRVDLEFDEQRRELEQAYETVALAAEPTVLKAQDRQLLDAAERLTLRRADGHSEPLLSPAELTSLRIERGSLTTEEIDEIRSHVVHTQRFLSRIPWGRTLRHVPAIAGAHHERLNGTGYPVGSRAEEIPLQSKMMSVADIYDALTASDRPYKRAVSPERALQILAMEVRDGHLDGDLVQLFEAAKVWVGPSIG